MEMTNRHQLTLLIWRVFVIGDETTPSRVRDRILRLAMDRVQGLERVPKKAILFRPREKLLEVVEALPEKPDALFIVPEGTELHFPETYDAWVVRYQTLGTFRKGAIELHWAPTHGATFTISHVDDTPVEDCQTSGVVSSRRIREKGPTLPLRVEYRKPLKGSRKKARDA